MKMVKTLLLGSAAGLMAVAGAQAADLPDKAKLGGGGHIASIETIVTGHGLAGANTFLKSGISSLGEESSGAPVVAGIAATKELSADLAGSDAGTLLLEGSGRV